MPRMVTCTGVDESHTGGPRLVEPFLHTSNSVATRRLPRQSYLQVTSIAKKWSNTSRSGWLASFFSGLRM